MKALKDSNGETLTTRSAIERRCQQFYTELFDSKKCVLLIQDETHEEEILPILKAEVKRAIRSTKNNKASGPDGITNESLKEGPPHFFKPIAQLFDKCLAQENVPDEWKSSKTVIIPKK